MHRIRGFVLTVLLLVALWLLLTRPFSVPELIAGAVAAIMVACLPTGAVDVLGAVRISPRAIAAAVGFVVVFLIALVRANIDVALRVLSPSLRISPGIVRIRTSLQSALARTLLANSITLTPGTITVDIEGDILYVHWISVEGDDIEEATRRIVGEFERYLEVFLG